MEQVQRYYEVLFKLKRKESRESAIIQAMAAAYASGSLKKDAWDSFLNSLHKETIDVDTDQTIQDMKKQGFKIEER